VGERTPLEENDMDGSLNAVQVRSPEGLERLEKLMASRQLPGRLERVDHLQHELEQALDLLAQALSPVLAPQGPSPVQSMDPEQDPRTELAGWLDRTANTLSRTVAFVRDLTDRVDL
jgi:hypothetical protein